MNLNRSVYVDVVTCLRTTLFFFLYNLFYVISSSSCNMLRWAIGLPRWAVKVVEVKLTSGSVLWTLYCSLESLLSHCLRHCHQISKQQC